MRSEERITSAVLFVVGAALAFGAIPLFVMPRASWESVGVVAGLALLMALVSAGLRRLKMDAAADRALSISTGVAMAAMVAFVGANWSAWIQPKGPRVPHEITDVAKLPFIGADLATLALCVVILRRRRVVGVAWVAAVALWRLTLHIVPDPRTIGATSAAALYAMGPLILLATAHLLQRAPDEDDAGVSTEMGTAFASCAALAGLLSWGLSSSDSHVGMAIVIFASMVVLILAALFSLDARKAMVAVLGLVLSFFAARLVENPAKLLAVFAAVVVLVIAIFIAFGKSWSSVAAGAAKSARYRAIPWPPAFTLAAPLILAVFAAATMERDEHRRDPSIEDRRIRIVQGHATREARWADRRAMQQRGEDWEARLRREEAERRATAAQWRKEHGLPPRTDLRGPA